MTLGYRFNRWPFKHKKKSSSRSGRAEKSNLNPSIGLHGFFFFAKCVWGESRKITQNSGRMLPACTCVRDEVQMLYGQSKCACDDVSPFGCLGDSTSCPSSLQSSQRFRCRSVLFPSMQEQFRREVQETRWPVMVSQETWWATTQERLRVKRATLLYIQHHMSHTFPKPTPFTGLVPHCCGACLLHVAWKSV